MRFQSKRTFYGLLIVTILLYTMLDILANGSYSSFIEKTSFLIVFSHIVVNLILSVITAYVGDMAGILKASKRANIASNIPLLGVIYGIFTFGCAPCILGFLATFGISYSVSALPFANLPYKFISLLIVIIGYFVMKEIQKRVVCKL